MRFILMHMGDVISGKVFNLRVVAHEVLSSTIIVANSISTHYLWGIMHVRRFSDSGQKTSLQNMLLCDHRGGRGATLHATLQISKKKKKEMQPFKFEGLQVGLRSPCLVLKIRIPGNQISGAEKLSRSKGGFVEGLFGPRGVRRRRKKSG